MNNEDLIINLDEESKKVTLETLDSSGEPKMAIEVTAGENQLPVEKEYETSLELAKLTPEERDLVLELAKKIDLSTTENIISYGISAQNKLAAFSEEILKTVRQKGLDNDVAQTLTDLAIEINKFDITEGSDSGVISGFFKGIGKVLNKSGDAGKQLKKELALSKKEIENLQIRFDNVSEVIDKIVQKLEQCKVDLVTNVSIMDQMYDKNLIYYKELTLYIIAGQEKLKMYDEEIEAQRKIATDSNDQMEIQILNEMNETRLKFQSKLDDLLKSRLISIQNAPQIRLVQNGSEQLVYQIQNSILTSIPIWKSQMVIALGIATNKSALGVQKHINQATNDILKKNSEMLKQGTLEIAEEAGKGIVEVETLQKTNKDLIDTIKGVMEIQKANAEKRAAAEKEILRLEGELKETLLNANS